MCLKHGVLEAGFESEMKNAGWVCICFVNSHKILISLYFSERTWYNRPGKAVDP